MMIHNLARHFVAVQITILFHLLHHHPHHRYCYSRSNQTSSMLKLHTIAYFCHVLPLTLTSFSVSDFRRWRTWNIIPPRCIVRKTLGQWAIDGGVVFLKQLFKWIIKVSHGSRGGSRGQVLNHKKSSSGVDLKMFGNINIPKATKKMRGVYI